MSSAVLRPHRASFVWPPCTAGDMLRRREGCTAHDRCRQTCRVSADVVATRFQAQFLGEQRGADTIEVCERLLAVQAQGLRCSRLAIRARTSGLTVTDVD
jgi:hypothetical protein